MGIVRFSRCNSRNGAGFYHQVAPARLCVFSMVRFPSCMRFRARNTPWNLSPCRRVEEPTKREVSIMRFFLGIIVGCALTVLTAYVIDNRAAVVGVDAAPTRQMVNWDIVSQNWQQFSDRVRGEWRRLSNS